MFWLKNSNPAKEFHVSDRTRIFSPASVSANIFDRFRNLWMTVGGEQEVYENVDFAAKEDLLRWLDLDYTQVNTAHHLRNKVRLTQTPALRTPDSYSSIKDDIRSGEKILGKQQVLYMLYRKSAGIVVCVCVCVWEGENS
jgi:hypothetical protein